MTKETTMRNAVLLAAGLMAAASYADEGAVDYREHTMEAVGGHMQAAVDIIRGKVSHASQLPIHAGALAELAEIAPSLFPEGSEGGDALPEIWSNPDDFAERLTAFQEAAADFDAAVATGEDIGPAVQALGQACKGCHDNYRKE
jgi:cytochrome c556